MSSINMFNTGKSALFANKASLATTGHNIANANTEGYSRQRVDQTAQDPHATIGSAVFGTGVKVAQIARINDDYLSRQIAQQQKYLGAAEEKDFALGQAEAIFNELNNEGLNRLMSNFFNEFRKLGNQPENEALRMTVRESTQQLLSDFHRIHRGIDEIQRNIDSRIDHNVRQINDLIKRIANLNTEIKRMELSGGQTGDLRDKRDLALKELSSIIDVSLSVNEKGDYTVSITGVGPLVSGNQYNQMKTEMTKGDYQNGKPDGALDIFLENFVPPKITQRLGSNGKLGGLVESRDQTLGTMRRRMDEVAFIFSAKVNEIHRQGYSIDGGTGRDFFKRLDRIEDAAANLKLSDAVLANPMAIATALEPDAPGDNRLVQQITALQYERHMNGGRATFDDYYNGTVADLATVQQKNKQVYSHQRSISGQLEKFRESISGVSLDEETTNLIQYQHAFDAAARVIKVADETLETILNLRRI